MEIRSMTFLGLHAGSSEQQTYLTIMKKREETEMGLCSISDHGTNSVLSMPSAAVGSSTEL